MAIEIRLAQSQWDALTENERIELEKSVLDAQCCMRIVETKNDEI